ncbi:Radical SAM domain-containing protein [Desulfonema limicola]|uniref:Radical SAM domain-containing protein n=1 Tax=Desulfonema limicola TaxID=45656 RepID=A0A975GHF4_9BACT|nr:class I SAM-dependent methyltransferase [Desulfonema limicola]QTA81375.1 Radical SAM domain-containing protein [Desulfonema limicola]
MTDYYHKNFQTYYQKTFCVDPSSFLIPLIKRLSQKAKILDLGCGSGRDLLWLKNHGFEPVGFEQSPGLAELARKLSGCRVIKGNFEEFDFSFFSFDALIMIGSLVHVSHKDFPDIFERITLSLCKKGYVLITLKKGNGIKKSNDGRSFYLWQDNDLEQIFYKKNFKIIDFFIQSSIVSPDDTWLGYVLQKKAA